ncbi:MAG: hypothetical protein JWN88_3102, partial [Frankiales bacterium]|nr:hypothetical protein [Frankiales bacterium]
GRSERTATWQQVSARTRLQRSEAELARVAPQAAPDAAAPGHGMPRASAAPESVGGDASRSVESLRT